MGKNGKRKQRSTWTKRRCRHCYARWGPSKSWIGMGNSQLKLPPTVSIKKCSSNRCKCNCFHILHRNIPSSTHPLRADLRHSSTPNQCNAVNTRRLADRLTSLMITRPLYASCCSRLVLYDDCSGFHRWRNEVGSLNQRRTCTFLRRQSKRPYEDCPHPTSCRQS